MDTILNHSEMLDELCDATGFQIVELKSDDFDEVSVATYDEQFELAIPYTPDSYEMIELAEEYEHCTFTASEALLMAEGWIS